MTPLNRCPICGRTWLDGSPMACDHSWAEWEQHRKREAEPEGELALSPRQRLRKALFECGVRAQSERDRADAAEARVKVLEEQVSALKGTAVGLLGLLNLVKNAHAKHREPRLEMPSDAMFERMIADNETRIERARAALASKEEGGR